MKNQQKIMNIKTAGGVKQTSSFPVEQMIVNAEVGRDIEQRITKNPELCQIAAELKELILALKEREPASTGKLLQLQNAEAAAQIGNYDQAIAVLKGSAHWLGEFATKVGASVIAKLIETHVGL